MANLDTTYLSFLPLVSRVAPDARVLPTGPIDFTIDSQWNVDLSAVVAASQLKHAPQGLFVDASNIVSGSTQITIFGTGQTIVVPAGIQGYYPILCTTNTFQFIITNLGIPYGSPRNAAILYIFFVNIPVVASQWQTLSPTGSGGYGNGGLGANPLGN